MKLTLGTRNPGKLSELFHLAKGAEKLTLQLAPDGFAPEETGSTYEENALIKALAAAKLALAPAVGEDSGIEVDALNGKPGIFSARYCPGSDKDRCHKLLDDLAGKPQKKRSARYVCAMALVDENGKVLKQTIGKWEGQIALAEAGTNGFGYDPIFYLPEYGKTAAQLTSEEKNRISHRALAWKKMLAFIIRWQKEAKRHTASLKSPRR
jgi:XTP/dITP diphosphohydrolase